MEEARARVAAHRLNAAHPERETWEWKALPGRDSDWAVVRVPRRTPVEPVTATSEAVPKPPQPDDPWIGPLYDLPGYR